MTHRRETILDTVATKLTGLATTGSNVNRARAYKIASANLPALTIAQGQDIAAPDAEKLSGLMRELSVVITAHARLTTNLETELNTISAEVYAALQADITQGLAYVFDTRIVGESAPEIEGGDTEKPVGQIDMEYVLLYEHSETSAEA